MTVIGHTKVRQQLSNLLLKQQFPQTTLVYGLNGCGKKMVVLSLAQALLCENPIRKNEMVQGCDKCRSCLVFASQNHPDFIFIEPTASKSQQDKKSATKLVGSIKTEQMTEMKSKLVYSPLMSDKQVVVVDDAQLMTNVTANSLLKLLEEPRQHQYFILITSQLHKILMTIRSRATKIFFPPLKEQEILQILKEQSDQGIDEDLLPFYSECFPGSPSHILAALKIPLAKKEWFALMEGKKSLQEASGFIGKILSQQIDLKLLLQILRGVTLKQIKKQGSATSRELDFFNRIQNAERQLERHIQEEFVLENLFLN